MSLEDKGGLACMVLLDGSLAFMHLFGEAISELTTNTACHCIKKLLFEMFSTGCRVLAVCLLEVQKVVPLGSDGDR